MFYLHILGDPSLAGPDGPVSGRAAYKRRIALLAVLALARGRPVGRERLIGLLWPEHPGEAARRTLSESLYVLRKELGEDVFTAPGDEVGLNASVVACDAAEFEGALEAGELERAAGLYGGPLLDGFYVADAPDFERWVDGERDRLARAYARALESLAQRAQAEGSALRAVDWWRRLAAHEPYSGRVALRLMQALDAAGERVAALRAAETHAMLLRAELELEPDPEVLDYVERLRTEPARASAPPPPPRAAPAASETRPPSADPPSIPAAAPEPADDPTPIVHAAEPPVASPAAADAAPDIHPPTLPPAHPADPPARTAAPSPATPVPHRQRKWMLAGGLGIAAVLAVFFGAWLGRRGDETKDAPAGHDPRRIAVLYFDDHSAGGQLQYLANGLTEMLIHELSQVPALDVVSRNGVKPFRDGRTPLDSIVAALRVGSVVEGSVQRLGDSVRVVVQLIDASTQSHLESRTVTRPASDGPALEDALAQEVSAFLRRRLGQTVALRQTRGETRSAAAHELVLRAEQLRDDAAGLAGMGHASDRGSAVLLLNRADSLLARAQAADPGWTRPRVLRALVAYSLAERAPPARQEALLRAAAGHADAALDRGGGDAPALEARGLVRWRQAVGSADTAVARARLDEAERDLRAALAQEPERASAWATLSQVLRFRGRFAEADLAARRALEQDAYLAEADDILHRLYSSALALADHPAAWRECERGRRQFPADWRFVECGLTLMREDTLRAPDPEGAWRMVAQLDRLDPPARARAEGRGYSPVYRRALVAAVLARAGARDSARAVLARARRDAAGDADSRVALLYDEAYALLLLGERAQAQRVMRAYVDARPALRPYLMRDPLVRGLLTP